MSLSSHSKTPQVEGAHAIQENILVFAIDKINGTRLKRLNCSQLQLHRCSLLALIYISIGALVIAAQVTSTLRERCRELLAGAAELNGPPESLLKY